MSGGINFGNIFNAALQVGLGALTGGTSLLATAAMSFAKQLFTQVFNQVVDALPIPQTVKDAMQAAFAAGIGDYQGLRSEAYELIQNAANSDPRGNFTGDLDRAVNDLYRGMDNLLREGIRRSRSAAGGAEGGSGGESWLIAMAEALGSLMGDKAEKMLQALSAAEAVNSRSVGNNDQAGQARQAREFNLQMARFQGFAQEFSIVSNAASTAIKAVGEGAGGVARKQ